VRILKFDNCSTRTDSPATPSLVLGQPDLSTCTTGSSLSQVNNPSGMYLDPSGTLWVADTTNHRVLRFDNAASKSNGASADGFLGVTGSNSCSRSKFTSPGSVTGDGSTLWVSDSANNRIMVYLNAASKANSANADYVIGKTTFTSCTSGTSSTKLDNPAGLFYNQYGTLLVSDAANNRVLGFHSASSISSNGPAASFVVGQSSFTTSSSGTSATKMKAPNGLCYENVVSNGTFVVADQNNNRVLVWCSD